MRRSVVFAFIMIFTIQAFAADKLPVADDTKIDSNVPSDLKAVIESGEKVDTPASGVSVKFFSDTLDFGKINPKSIHNGVFKFINNGTKDFKVDHIKSTCGCTVPELDKKEYKPGEAGEIKVRYTSSSSEGEVTKHLYVFSNVKGERTELKIKSEVVLQLELNKKKIELRLDKPNSGMPELVLTSRDGQEFAITGINSRIGAITCAFDAKKKAKEFKFTPLVDLTKFSTQESDVLTITTDHPQCKQVSVPLFMIPLFQSAPARIVVTQAEPGVPEVRDIWLKNNYKKQIKIKEITSASAVIKVLSTEDHKDRLLIKVQITPPAKEKKERFFKDTLTIVMQDGKKIDVPCFGFYVVDMAKRKEAILKAEAESAVDEGLKPDLEEDSE